MMHPTMVTALAAERRADLLREAEVGRRVALLTGRRRPLLARAADRVELATVGLRRRLATSTQLSTQPSTRASAQPSTQPSTQLCCA